MATPTTFELSLIDYTSESTRTKFYMPEVTALSFATVTAAANAIRVAMEAITLANEKALTASIPVHEANGLPPSDVHAQRELALKIFYTDNVTGDKGNLSLGAPDLTLLTISKGDVVSITTGAEMIALVGLLNTTAQSRLGNDITVTAAKIVGRNN